MIIHDWNVTPQEAVQIQERLRSEVRIERFGKKIHTIAGCDVSLDLYATTIYAGFVVLSYPDMKMIDHMVVRGETHFPYVPGLLSFREIPALVQEWEKLKAKADIIMVDGQGVAHPRRLGIASHLGVVLDMPTIGCAKSVLTGTYEKPERPGDISPLIDRRTGESIGTVLQSKARSNPLIVSAGHKITQEESVAVVRACLRGYRLPEPTRQAHLMVNRYRKSAGKSAMDL